MIDENKTFIIFRYTSNTLSKHSNKKVWRICNCCKEERLVSYRKCTNLCFKCSHKTKEYKSKLSKSNIGKHHSEETKLKMSKSKQGIYDGDKNPMYGKHHTKETKCKQSKASTGINNYMYGKKHSEETKRKISKTNSKENHPQWKGGQKLTNARRKVKRRQFFGFIPHNKPQENFHGHHVDFNHVIFIPKDLHISISHSVINNKNINTINDAVCDWYLKDQIII